jgi:SAM-dependent methyltransferase
VINQAQIPSPLNAASWEMAWAPYDEGTYRSVMACFKPDDVVLEIGAGDLRLAQRLAQLVKKVYAIEIQAPLLEQARKQLKNTLADNLHLINGDARLLPFPPDVTGAVLLMRHCRSFQRYAEKLKDLGCRQLVTNARWHFAVEAVQLQTIRESFTDFELGWYACWCGAAGFKTGPVELFTPELDTVVHEVVECPYCDQ